MLDTPSSQKITYIFRSGRVERMNTLGSYPSEFLYGCPQLQSNGVKVDLLEDSDIGMSPPLFFTAWLTNKFARIFARIPIGMVVPLFYRKYRNSLPFNGIIIATTNGIGLALGAGHRLGLVKSEVVLLAMGLTEEDSSYWRRFLISLMVRKIHIATISKPEKKFLQGLLPHHHISYLPFGVDHRFWYPNVTKKPSVPFVLTIGNDLNRDWETLVNAWDETFPLLKIITSLPVNTSAENIQVIRGDWRNMVLTDEMVRDLYWQSEFVIVPVKETIQPTGQSACLQAMACGKAVIMGNNRGLWDKDIMIDGENLLLSPVSDVRSLNLAIKKLVTQPSLREKLGEKARHTIEHHYNCDRMAAGVISVLDSLSQDTKYG